MQSFVYRCEVSAPPCQVKEKKMYYTRVFGKFKIHTKYMKFIISITTDLAKLKQQNYHTLLYICRTVDVIQLIRFCILSVSAPQQLYMLTHAKIPLQFTYYQ